MWSAVGVCVGEECNTLSTLARASPHPEPDLSPRAPSLTGSQEAEHSRLGEAELKGDGCTVPGLLPPSPGWRSLLPLSES